MKFYTSDTHFSHFNVIRYANRPFKTADEMNETMIYNWNNVVRPNDEIYHLGDFAFAQADVVKSILSRLNGRKYLIFGNHDGVFFKNPELFRFFEKSSPMMEVYEQDPKHNRGRQSIVLCHYAMKVWNKSHHGALQFYGHSHGSLPGTTQSIDVGVDVWNYAPTTYEQVKKALINQTPFRSVDHHGNDE